jgi:hypothetical protein
MQVQQAQVSESNNRLFVKAFLIDNSLNINNWRVTKASIERNINSFIGKPLVLTQDYNHPSPNEGNPESLDHWLQYQETFRVGTIIDITTKQHPSIPDAKTYHAIIEVTNPDVKQALHDNKVPVYVSPAIAEMTAGNPKTAFHSWEHCHDRMMSEYGDKETADRVCGYLKSIGQASMPPNFDKAAVKALAAMTWDECIAKATDKGADDPEALCGWLRFHGPNAKIATPTDMANSDLVSEWHGVHLAIVDQPAFGIKKATISAQCGGDKEACLMQLRTAHINNHGIGKCGFCVKKAMQKYRNLREFALKLADDAAKTTITDKDTSLLATETPKIAGNYTKMSQLEATTEPTNTPASAVEQQPTKTEVVEKVEYRQPPLTKAPVQYPGQPTTDLLAKIEKLEHMIQLKDLKIDELSGINDTFGQRVAALESERRRERLERIITSDVIKDEKTRIDKIKYFLSKKDLPIEDIEEIYRDNRILARKASAASSTRRGVPYLGATLGTSGVMSSGQDRLNMVDEETGLTPLQKQLAVLKGGL